MGKFTRMVKAAFNEAVKPESFAKGEEFEEYVREWIFTDEFYGIVSKTHDYSQNRKDYVETSLEPDFCLVDFKSEREFFVEAKFRSDYWKGAIEWSKPYQLKRYKEIDRDIPVFIIIGVGGNPKRPEEIFIFPVRQIKYPKLFESTLEEFDWEPDSAIRPKHLWSLLK